ncbi:MAG TPA: di-heme oxidoredictase family protein [Flavobacterium sp.]|nr:di-heme oxidoredictase family protein [Flavobacterium sp.]
MTKRILLLLVLSATLFSCNNEDSESDYINIDDRLNAGGETTIFSATSNSFALPAPNLSDADYESHLAGDFQFESTFITAPATINQGLGPIFNNNSCVTCHPRDGRAKHPTNINAANGLLVRASIFGTDEHGGPVPVPGFGLQIQNRAITGYTPEAVLNATYVESTETLADGTQITLRKPIVTLSNPYIALPAGVMLSTRLAPPVFGLGLLEAIPEANLVAAQDINDSNGDGISGKANYVWDSQLQQTLIGRFGWKANTATLVSQCAAAYVEDMGITSYMFQNESGWQQSNGNDGITDDPEITPEVLNSVVLYCRTLGVPAPRNIDKENVKRGAKIFEQIDCAKCHTPKQQTGNSAITALKMQTFYPYTDLLLHDMGTELADNRPDYLASGTEWKTRPLWGIGLTNLINGHTDFLHDGRARNITEAILWHGGEAQNAKNKFKQLSTSKRNDLLDFINSL